jgi:hypothetical protein
MISSNHETYEIREIGKLCHVIFTTKSSENEKIMSYQSATHARPCRLNQARFLIYPAEPATVKIPE